MNVPTSKKCALGRLSWGNVFTYAADEQPRMVMAPPSDSATKVDRVWHIGLADGEWGFDDSSDMVVPYPNARVVLDG